MQMPMQISLEEIITMLLSRVAQQFQSRIAIFVCHRIAIGKDCTDFDPSDACFEIKLNTEHLCNKLFLRNMGQDFLRIDEDSMSTGRSLIRNTVFVEFAAEVFHLLDACFKIIVLGAFV